MKKLLILAAAVMICSTAGAQVMTTYKLDKKALLGNIERSDEDIAHPKRTTRGQTWLDRGDAMFRAASLSLLSFTYPGQPEKEMLTNLGKKEPQTVTVSGRELQKFDYPFADIYVKDGVVQFWVMKETVLEGADEKAVEAYRKAAELDPKLTEKAAAGMTNVSNVISIAANAQQNLGNLEEAADLHLKSFNVKREPLVGKIDSISVFNAGYIFLSKEKYDRAIPIFETAIANNVWEEGKTPYYLSYSLMQLKRYDEAKKVLDKGLQMFPGDKNMMDQMVYYYSVTGGDFNEIKNQLQAALDKDPSNHASWNGLAQIYIDAGETDKSIEFFTKYVAKFPESAQSNFYLGDAWYVKGNELREAAENDKSMSKAAVDAKMEEAKQAYRQAWKYLKVSYDQNQEDAVLQRFTFTTYRLLEDPGMEALYNDDLWPKYQKVLDANRGK